ncbi:probable E3 SUMO-protein ligase RNF212 isoform X2 [Corvus cornix cornix]|uniref:probable E3 SUMO-protein ligase RNF212 isoform X2 n=1 Tax=Corvus brachyrhynchos TaxID=85066 RepID=UPI0008165C75|nr:PREDICTED: probable E3 SUMO-protein ligase RNF212 isoform X2 [Corvus brachyrhynchos]XP_019142501.1 probable E3 SUMO-protein ligase RNF212 isoform X2 [Corvus cornix cornix]XP_048160467.1 probable E3 SUMO-protein ligase RNF212 isoform X2 [Corvus hawaiiensis]
MAVPVFCNSCLCEPRNPTPPFSLTSCGHVFCEICLKKGKKDECLICRTACRTLVLSKQVSEFQEKHRKHLLAYHKQKIAKLEESLKKVTQQVQQIQCMKPPEKTTPLPFSSTSRNPFSIPSRKQNVYSSYSLHSSRPSTSETMEAMEIDPVPSPVRKLETPTGPTRLSVITPPQDGRMGSVSYRSSQTSLIMPSQNIGAASTRSTPVRLPHSVCPSSSGSQSSRRGSWASSDFRTPQLYPFTSPSPQLPLSRQPITISGLLQRQQPGPTNFGGHSAER